MFSVLKPKLCSSVFRDLLNYEVGDTWNILWKQIIIPGVSILNSLWTTQIFSNLIWKLCKSLFKDLLNCKLWDTLNVFGKIFLFHVSQIQNVANCAIFSVESLGTFLKINNIVQSASDFFESLKTKWLVSNLFHVTPLFFLVSWMKKSQSLQLDCFRGESQRTYMEIQYLFQSSHKCLNI